MDEIKENIRLRMLNQFQARNIHLDTTELIKQDQETIKGFRYQLGQLLAKDDDKYSELKVGSLFKPIELLPDNSPVYFKIKAG